MWQPEPTDAFPEGNKEGGGCGRDGPIKPLSLGSMIGGGGGDVCRNSPSSHLSPEIAPELKHCPLLPVNRSDPNSQKGAMPSLCIDLWAAGVGAATRALWPRRRGEMAWDDNCLTLPPPPLHLSRSPGSLSSARNWPTRLPAGGPAGLTVPAALHLPASVGLPSGRLLCFECKSISV